MGGPKSEGKTAAAKASAKAAAAAKAVEKTRAATAKVGTRCKYIMRVVIR
jgi:hypothetical protein